MLRNLRTTVTVAILLAALAGGAALAQDRMSGNKMPGSKMHPGGMGEKMHAGKTPSHMSSGGGMMSHAMSRMSPADRNTMRRAMAKLTPRERNVMMKAMAMKDRPPRVLIDSPDVAFLLSLPETNREQVRDYFARHGLLDLFDAIDRHRP